MEQRRLYSLFLLIALSWCGCENDDTIPAKKVAQYTIISMSRDSWGIESSNIFVYNASTKILSSKHFNSAAIFNPLSPHDGYRFKDVMILDDYAYSVNSYGNVVSKVNLTTFELEKSNSLKFFNAAYSALVGYRNNQILLAGATYTFDQSYFGFIKTYDTDLNLVDSLNFGPAIAVFDMIIADDMLLLAVQKDDVHNSVMALNPKTKALIKEFEMPADDSFYEFIASDDHEVLILGREHVYNLNTSTLEVKNLLLDVYMSLNQGPVSSVVLTSDNKLYYFIPSAQPAPFPLLLNSYDLNSRHSESVTTLDDFAVQPPIAYDQENDVLIAANYGSIVRILKRDGTLVSEFLVPGEKIADIIISYE